MRIVQIIPENNFILFVQFDNGISGTFDLKPYLNLEVFKPLHEDTEFRKVRNGGYYIDWPCGADLSADTIEAHLNVSKNAVG